MATKILINSGPGDAMLPDGTLILPEPALAYHQWVPVAPTWAIFYRNCSRYQFKNEFELYILKLFQQIRRSQWNSKIDHMKFIQGNIPAVCGILCFLMVWHRLIWWSLEAVRFDFRLFKSLWNLIGNSAAAMSWCLSNFRAIPSL